MNKERCFNARKGLKMREKTPKVSAFALDIERLKPGDIILSRETATINELVKNVKRLAGVIQSRVVRIFTSEYSHAMLYLDKEIIHAIRPLVYSYNPQRISISKEDDLCVLRYPNLSEDQLYEMDLFARSKIGAEYSISEAIKVPWRRRTNSNADSQSQFCSRFVAQAYQAAGIKLVSNSDYCTPTDFLHNDLLTKVSNVIRIATKEDVAIWKTPDGVTRTSLKLNKWLNFVRECAKGDGVDIQSTDDALEYVLNHPHKDDVIANMLIETGYLDRDKERSVEADYRYNPELRYNLIFSNQSTLMTMCKMEVDYIVLHAQNLAGLTIMNAGRNLKTISLFMDLQKQLIKDGQHATSALLVVMHEHFSQIDVSELSKTLQLCNELQEGNISNARCKEIFHELRKCGRSFLDEVSIHANL